MIDRPWAPWAIFQGMIRLSMMAEPFVDDDTGIRLVMLIPVCLPVDLTNSADASRKARHFAGV